MKYCNSCLIPETAETNKYDDKGVCSVCNQVATKEKINWTERQKQLDIIIDEHKNKYQYDCIVPFSGGKDSTFTLWYLTVKKHLKTLAVRFDHNFLRPNLNKNVEKTLSKLGVDFLNYKSNFKLVQKIMLESLKRRGDFCWHCHVGISAFPINTAIEKKIPLLFYGEPSSEYSSYYSYDTVEMLDVEKFNRISNLGINAEDMLEMLKESYPKEKFNIKDFKPYIFPSQREIVINNIKPLYLGNYIPWDVKEQVKIIKQELDWKGDRVEGIPENYDYEKIECIMQGSRDFSKFLKRGFGRTTHLMSIDLRNKRIKRDKAKKLVKKHDGKKPKTLSLLLKILNISEDEYYKIIKGHVVYPNKFPDRIENDNSNFFLEDIEYFENKFKLK